jgi:2,3-dihydroxybiphenyl 1,2-dioxygenase
MELSALGYIGITSARLQDWRDFACLLLGMQQVDAARAGLAFRMDDRRQRLLVERGDADGLGFLGWEVARRADLDAVAARVEAAGIAVLRGSAVLAAQRHVGELITFDDPDGNRVEVFCAAEIAADPFVPGRPVSGFRTGPLGMGHAVLHVTDVARLLPFYRDVLGFRISDYGKDPYPVYFLHLNQRHHSFAMVGSGRRGLHHFMVEMGSLDDVGQGYDLALGEPGRVAYTLGRHSNDYITSFYANAPSGFFVEYGWGGRDIDPARWTPHETFDGPSFWGHDRLALSEDLRTQFRDLRLAAAARGVRAPVENCPWLDAVIGDD